MKILLKIKRICKKLIFRLGIANFGVLNLIDRFIYSTCLIFIRKPYLSLELEEKRFLYNYSTLNKKNIAIFKRKLSQLLLSTPQEHLNHIIKDIAKHENLRKTLSLKLQEHLKLIVSAQSLNIRLSGLAATVLMSQYSFKSILDIGFGDGKHSRFFLNAGKSVTGIDIGRSIYFDDFGQLPGAKVKIGDFLKTDFANDFDCVWASHVLEHQRNVGDFLDKCYDVLKPGGILAVTVPPKKNELVGGHLTLWTPASLVYNLVLAGFDCREAKVLKYGYNITVICNKAVSKPDVSTLAYDNGDIQLLKEFLPPDVLEGMDGEALGENYSYEFLIKEIIEEKF